MSTTSRAMFQSPHFKFTFIGGGGGGGGVKVHSYRLDVGLIVSFFHNEL